MPFVLIQILMVGLIIAFPKLVSSNLGKEPTVDVDKAFQQMQMPSKEAKPDQLAPSTDAASAPTSAQSGSAGGSAPAASDEGYGKGSDDDAMKRLLDSMQKDAPKKP